MTRLAIAMDIGTSGLRTQLIDLSSREILSTSITTRHPLPGVNVIDHLHFALEMGVEHAQKILIQAINRLVRALGADTHEIVRLAVCGNPTQLSLFQGIDIRDLAYAGQRKLEKLGIVPPKRKAAILRACDIPQLDLPAESEVIIPPSVRQAVGADALAMIIQSGLVEQGETALATDYGTNAEMALFHEGSIFTGSAAAGPALEGQQITGGMLALPGAISDLESTRAGQRLIVLNDEMFPIEGPSVDICDGRVLDHVSDVWPIGITGTGTVALVLQALESGLIALPHINTPDGTLHLNEELVFTEDDLKESGKAIGAVRAGHLTLCRKAGIEYHNIHTAYMSGASGTYIDARKAWKLNLIPSHARKVFQLGNTSLVMARELVLEPKKLDLMSRLADELHPNHCMFASSETFKKTFILELSYWTEGMPLSTYRKFLKKYGFPDLDRTSTTPEILRMATRDIDELGRKGMAAITNIDDKAEAHMEGCTACTLCVERCPAHALTLETVSSPPALWLEQSLCQGVACRRCERVCPEKVFVLAHFWSDTLKEEGAAWES